MKTETGEGEKRDMKRVKANKTNEDNKVGVETTIEYDRRITILGRQLNLLLFYIVLLCIGILVVLLLWELTLFFAFINSIPSSRFNLHIFSLLPLSIQFSPHSLSHFHSYYSQPFFLPHCRSFGFFIGSAAIFLLSIRSSLPIFRTPIH